MIPMMKQNAVMRLYTQGIQRPCLVDWPGKCKCLNKSDAKPIGCSVLPRVIFVANFYSA